MAILGVRSQEPEFRSQRAGCGQDMEDWLIYFLNGVARQSEDALSRAERINGQLDRWRAQISSIGSVVVLRLLDLLGSNPFITVRRTEAQLDVAYNTAAAALRRLAQSGIVKQQANARRGRVFCAQKLLGILEEPARLSPDEEERKAKQGGARYRHPPARIQNSEFRTQNSGVRIQEIGFRR